MQVSGTNNQGKQHLLLEGKKKQNYTYKNIAKNTKREN